MIRARPAPALVALSLAFAVSVTAAPPAAAAPKPARGIQGLVTAVTDGDTLTITPADGKPVTVRLRDIDAPEICQAWGPEARQALTELALNKLATLVPRARDRFGRTVGTLRIEELDVGRWLVENGHAWSVRTRYDRGPLVKQERMAKALSRGLHQGGGAIPPWDWRRNKGPCPDVGAAPAAAPAPTR